MKKLLLTLALAAAATFADAQGTIQLANNAGTRFTIFGVRPTVPILGGAVVFGVFVGATADALSTQPVGPLGTNTSTSGLISGPNPQAYAVPGEPNSTVFVQIRGWEARFLTWEEGQQGLHGQTAVRAVVLGPTTGPGTVVWSSTDLTKFQAIDCIPEPSAIYMTGLGLVGLLLLRRSKKF